MKFTRLLLAAVVLFCATVVRAVDPYVSEFVANNSSGLTDENNDRPDWIELRNPGSTAVSLADWFLTDSPSNLSKWRFPAVTMPAGSHLVVFASGKNRRVPGQNLHTNFSLKSGGNASERYLALVKPDGVTIASEYASYPAQYADTSYGYSLVVTDVTLIDRVSATQTAIKAYVPTSGDPIGTSWRAPGYDDSAWTLSGNIAVGYFVGAPNPNLTANLGLNLQSVMYQLRPGVYLRQSFTVPSGAFYTQLRLQVKYDDGHAVWLNGNFAAKSANIVDVNVLGPDSTVGSTAATSFTTYNLDAMAATLGAGTHVLATHLMNASTNSNDVYYEPILTAKQIGAANTLGYFPTPTPGAANGDDTTLGLPQTVVFSRASGTFQNTFNLTLSGAAGAQEIRYNISDPGSADLAEPTAASTLYTGPISIPTSKLIRARVVQGGLLGPTSTAQFLKLETAVGANNTSTFTSNLPLIVADNHGGGALAETTPNPFRTSFFYLYEPLAGVTSLNGQAGDGVPTLFSRNGIRVRGSSSSGFPKKGFAMELWNEKNQNQAKSLLGLDSDPDWVLNGPYQYDDTYIHNAMTYEISRRVGRWAPRTKPVELFFNSNGGNLDYTNDYQGLYILTEKIKSDPSRVDIEPITPLDNASPDVTGGYIFKIDRADAEEYSWRTTNNIPSAASGAFLIIVDPDADYDTTQQQNYLVNYVQGFDTAIVTESNNGFLTRNYKSYIDVGAWVDHHLINSLTFNVDALRLSAFFNKDRNKKIEAGPVWDFDRSLGSDDGRDANPQTWNNITYFFDHNANGAAAWWGRLFKDPEFCQAWIDRWWDLRQTGRPFDLAVMQGIATQMGNEIGNAAGARDAAKWTQNAPDAGQNYLNEITKMNTWLAQRVAWIDSQLPAPPTASIASGIVSPGTTVTLTAAGPINYTTNGTDPRPANGSTPGTGTNYTGPITLNATTVITTRHSGTFTPFPTATPLTAVNWSGVRTYVYLVNEFFATTGDLAISEINYNPIPPTAAEATAVPGIGADDFEFIEIKNIGTRTVNTFELSFPVGAPFERELRLSAKSLAPGDIAFVVKNKAAFEARYGTSQSAKIVGEWTEGTLDNNGETILLAARDNTVLFNFAYDNSGDWPGRADGKGSTLEYIGATFSNAAHALPASWRASIDFQGSPGTNGSAPITGVTINEIHSHSNLPLVDAIELKNLTNADINIGDWWISEIGNPETPDDYKQYRIPANTILPANGYLTFSEVQFHPNGTWNPGAGTPGVGEFAFDAHSGDDAYLFQGDATGKILKFVERVDFGAARIDESWGRWPDGTGSLYPMAQRTLFNEASATSPRPNLGAPNSLPRVGPLLISEIMHSPAGGNTDLEYIEIYNPTNATVALANWRLRGKADFDFTSETIPAGGIIVMVPFSTSDVTRVNAFRAAYGITAAVPLVGAWSSGGTLQTADDVTLYRAETPPPSDPGNPPHTIEDEVNYLATAPWPAAITGSSMTRIGTNTIGDLGTSWRTDLATPGFTGPTYARWLLSYFPGGGVGSGDNDDPDGDGMTNAQEYAYGTNPLGFTVASLLLPTLGSNPPSAGNITYTFTYQRPTDRPSAAYEVQYTDTFSIWTPLADTLISEALGVQTRRATLTVPVGDPGKFLRLKTVITP